MIERFFYISSQDRERHRASEEKIGELDVALHDPALTISLGGVATALSEALDYTYIPNIRHGEIQIPRRYKNQESIPVLSFYPDETLNVPPSILSMHRLQEEQAINYLATAEANTPKKRLRSDLRTAQRKQHSAGLDISMGEGAVASVTAALINLEIATEKADDDPRRAIATRPIVKLPVRDGEYSVSVGIHEMQHVVQGLAEPIFRIDDISLEERNRRFELEAYTVQAIAQAALYTCSTNPDFYGQSKNVCDISHSLSSLQRGANAL